MYGYDLLRQLDENQLRKLTLEGIGVAIDWEQAGTDNSYVLDIFDAAPVSSLHDMEQISGRPIDWAQLQADAGEGYVLQAWTDEVVESEAQKAAAEQQEASSED